MNSDDLVEPASIRLRFRFSLKALLISFVVIAAGLSYIGSYYQHSRRGIREAQEFGLAGFLYVPYLEVAKSKDLTHHHSLARFYAPVAWLDYQFLGSPGPVAGITW